MAKSAHGRLAGACANFIASNSEEAHAQRRAFAIVETPPPSVETPAYLEFDIEETTVVEGRITDADLMVEWKARALALGVLA
jgi:hypothetical protein